MNRKKILIAEDELLIARDLKNNLEQMGYSVTSISVSGEDAVKHAQLENPDLVLMDIRLKGKLDGIDAAKKIRAKHNIPVIYLTAFADEKTLQRAKITEPYAYILKPFENRELHSSIEIALYKHEAEQNLKEREQWLSTTLRSIGDAVISTDKKGLITYMNPIAENLCGVNFKSAQGEKLSDVFKIVNTITGEKVDNPVNKVLKSGQIVGLANHTMLLSKDGKKYQISDSGAPIKDADGYINGVVLVFRDITREYKMQENLRENENNLRVLFNAMTDVVFEMDYDGRYLNIAPTSQTHMFKPSKVTIGKTLHDLFPKSEADIFLGFIRKCLDENKINTIEYPLVINNKTRWFEGRATPKNENTVFYIARDITEHKQAEESIKEQLLFSNALNKIAQVVASDDKPENILKSTSTILGQTLKTDRAIIYNIDLKQGKIFGLSEWLNEANEISPTLNTYDISLFGDGINWLLENRTYIVSHSDQVAPPLQHDGSGEILHKQMEVKSGLWMPFNFRKNGFYLLVLNQVLYRRSWRKSELDFLSSVTGQINIALQKIQFIKDLQKSKTALQSSETKYRMLAENAVDFIFYMDLKFKLLYLSPYVFNSMGYYPEELIGTRLYKYMHRKEFIKIVRISMGVLLHYKSNPDIFLQTRLLNKKCQEVPVEISGKVVLDNKGKPIGLQGSVRDISERYKAEKALRKSEEKWRTLTENSPDHIMLLDTDYTIRFINHTVPDLTKELVIGKSNFDFIPDGYIKPAKDCFERVAQSRQAEHYETKYITEEGDELFFDVRISPIIDKEGKITSLISTSNNITHRIKTEKNLLAAKEKAEESDRLKSAFLANMSHEIRTPMNGILGFASLLKEPELTGEKLHKYLSIIENSGQRMLNIINDLIDISKLEAGQVETTISNVDINKHTKYLYSFFKPETEKKGILLHFKNNLPDTAAVIQTDYEKFFAVFTNLLKNAIKYTKKGSIEFGYNLKTDCKPAELEFYVKDTGIGISPDKQQLIFKRFVQADQSLTRDYEGAGLGLSISKAFVEMLGGKIWLESKEGVGSQFYFTIPYINENYEITEDIAVNGKAVSNTNKKLKILIAEDEETADLLLSIVLKNIGKEFIHTKTGYGAVEICKNNPDIDLVLMDIKMSQMDGYEATKQIRKFNKQVIIIAQTAYALTNDREKALNAGCNDYITKPIIRDELMDMIWKHVRREQN